MHDALERRLAIAERVVAKFKALSEIQGICACGSVGLGLADDESDLDLAFVCSPALPPAEERRGIYNDLCDDPADVDVDVLGPDSFDYLHVSGVQVEPEFHSLAQLSDSISRALGNEMCERSAEFATFDRPSYAMAADIHYWRIL